MVPSRVPVVTLRVCHVIHHLAPGGAERLLLQLADVAGAHRLELSILSIMDTRGFAYADALRDRGITLKDLGGQNRWDPRSLAAGIAAVRELKPDLLHTHLKHADIIGALASTRLGVPMVSTMHTIEDSVTPVERFKRYAGAWARVHRSSRTITVSDAQRAWYLDTFRTAPQRVVTIRNGVTLPPHSPDARSTVRSELGIDDEDVMVLMVGVMRPGKGHEQLLDAVERIPLSSPLRFVLAGDGPLREELQRRVSTSAAHGRVSLAGWRDDMTNLMTASDLVVHPTLFDALPTALIEALAAGRPIIASDVGGVPEIVTPSCGVLVPPASPEKLAGALGNLAADPAKRRLLSHGARQRYDEEFSAERWAERLRKLYEEVLAG